MSFNQIMIHFCAPTLCEIKPGNMFFVKNEEFCEDDFNDWKSKLHSRGITCFSIKLSDSSTSILVCNVCWARKILGNLIVQAYLSEKGYTCSNLFDFVSQFNMRIQNNLGFPHEIGVLLGYPVDDVIEFENHQGKNCKYCGYWKSYSDVEKAKACQCRYKNCSCMCKKWYDQGYSLVQIINEYKRFADAA